VTLLILCLYLLGLWAAFSLLNEPLQPDQEFDDCGQVDLTERTTAIREAVYMAACDAHSDIVSRAQRMRTKRQRVRRAA